MEDLLKKENQWWDEGQVKPSLLESFHREVFSKVQEFLNLRQIIAISGLRRVGKSVLLHQLIQYLLDKQIDPKKILYFSFDKEVKSLEELFETYSSITAEDLNKSKHYIFLDEVQKLPDWTNQIKTFYDLYPNLKFIISGSASLDLEKRGRESLAGRVFFVRMEPLSFREWLTLKNILVEKGKERLAEGRVAPLFRTYLHTAFPEIVGWTKSLAELYLRESVINRVLYKDIPEAFKEADPVLLRQILELVCANPGLQLNVDALARDWGRSKSTILVNLEYLKFSMLIREFGNYRGSELSSSRKLKKVYALHPSITAAYSEAKVSLLVENFVGWAIDAPFYWREKKKEVDFIADKPIEVKFRNEIKNEDLENIFLFMRKFGFKEGLMVSKNQFENKIDGDLRVSIEPAWCFALKNGKM